METYAEVKTAPKGGARNTTLMVALLAACIAYQLNASMLSPALEIMARELQTSARAVALSQTVFFTLAALFSLFLPRFSDIVGRRKVLSSILCIMVAGSVICALAPGIEVLTFGRAIQGVSGPIVQIALLMLRVKVTDAKQYGLLLGVITAVNGGIAGIDAIAGGYLATQFGFRSIFWAITVVSVIATGLVIVHTDESAPSAGTKMDWIGVVPLVISVMSLLIALSKAAQLQTANWATVALCALFGILAFIAFYVIEDRSLQPLVATMYLRQRGTWSLLSTTTLTLTGVYAAVYGVIASFAQNQAAGFGMKADMTSLVFLTPFALVGWIVGPVAGGLAPRLGYRRVMRIGLIACVVCLIVSGTLGMKSLPIVVTCTLIMGIAYVGMANIMLNGLGIVLSPAENPGFLPGLNAGAFNLGAGLSFATLTAIQVTGSPQGSMSSRGYSSALLVAATITAAAFLVSYLIPKPKNAEQA